MSFVPLTKETEEVIELFELVQVVLKHAKKVDQDEELTPHGTINLIDEINEVVEEGKDWLDSQSYIENES
jgi:hypothetical protein